MIYNVLLVGLAGALGTMARYGMTELSKSYFGLKFPVGTLIVNIIGCFIAGLLFIIADSHLKLSNETKAIIFIGFMGAFTTFSTFILDSGQFAMDSKWGLVIGNVLLQNAIGFGMFFVGIMAGKMLPKTLV